MSAWRLYWNSVSLRHLLVWALAVRLLAVCFSPGYIWHDDHFLTVEPASSWANGKNHNDWLPGIGNDRDKPEPVSFLYPVVLWVLFKGFALAGIDHPQTQMWLMRLLLALYSLLTVWLGYQIADRMAGRRAAIQAGLLLGFLAVMPNFSVRNLVETACIPPLLAVVWWLLPPVRSRAQTTASLKHIAIAAVFAGLAVGLRYQVVLMVGALGLVVLWEQRWLRAIVFGLVSFAVFFLTQADDLLLWGGKPFQHLLGYFGYNTTHAARYPGSPIAYLSFLTYFIFPPVSLFLLYGFFYRPRKKMLLVLPALFFIAFHVLYPNRQERFLLPALPLFVLAGVAGWQAFTEASPWWRMRTTLLRRCQTVFWSLNLTAMLAFCFVYGKRARVETMTYLYERGDLSNFIQEFSHTRDAAMLPQHYSNDWQSYYTLRDNTNTPELFASMADNAVRTQNSIHEIPMPNYVIFMDDERLNSRVDSLKKYFPGLQPCTTMTAGNFDRLLHYLNPLNRVETIHIYATNRTQ